MNRTLTFKVELSSAAETWEAINKKAEEEGYNRFYTYDFSEVWPSEVRKCDIYESKFERFSNGKKERLHIICENHYKQTKKDAETRSLTINND